MVLSLERDVVARLWQWHQSETISWSKTAINQMFASGDHVMPASINRGEYKAVTHAVNDRLDDEITILTTTDIIGGGPEKQPEPWHVWLSNYQ